jgi:hypothetical protein
MGMIVTDSSGGRKSDGRTMLLAVLRSTSEREVSRLVGCSQQFVSLCAAGKSTPQRWALREAFWVKLRIPAESW